MVKIKGEVRYPSRGDKFFVDKGDPDEIAWLHKTFQEFGSYADSYQTGALTILDSAIANPDLRDFNIYPAVFLIRHYLELRLKELKQGLNYCIEQKRNFPTGHDLQHLWSEFQRGYEQLTDEIDKDRFEIISELITEINNVDPISMAFRYPVDKKGKKTQKLEYVNLQILRESFIRVCFVFDGISDQISGYIDMNEEMLNDIYRSYWSG